MKTGTLHINERKPTEAEIIINDLLGDIYLLRKELNLNHLPSEERAWKYLKEKYV